MRAISADELARITNFSRLVDLLRDKLDWPIGEDYGFEDVVFEYAPGELGLKPEEIAKIREIHQLRPLVDGQPWGIFFVSFEEKTISITVLRRMLRALVVKKRAGSAAVYRQTWQLHDLVFAANFGKSGERELAIVHFSDENGSGDLPVLKVLGWNAKDTFLHNDHVARVLSEKLRWPDEPDDKDEWRASWSAVFETRHNEVIQTSKDLAIRLASLATDIRARANQLLKAETDDGAMRKMLEAFRKNLIQDLDEDGFADMFAQTIAYGLLAARISRPSGALVADNLTDMVPKTNPFLRELFETFLALGGRDKRKEMDFDELGVRNVVDMLVRTNMEAVLRDFGDRNPKEDPVIHFYELFLKEYDPQKRMQRGVFYTPRPVVNFIVRGVDEILRTEFDVPLGLADTMTWAELAARNDKITIPEHVDPNAPFVQILDPATGTGTFLVEVIDLIHKRMMEHWKAQKWSEAEIQRRWNEYVPRHLLPRLSGFELMMAPYAIAHMKIGLKLVETGYRFGSDERAHVFLTNALEPAHDLTGELQFIAAALAHEAAAANTAKTGASFTVVIGNPPYAGYLGERTRGTTTKRNLWGSQAYDGVREEYFLRLPKAMQRPHVMNNLADDFVAFFHLCQRLLRPHGAGQIVGLITNRSYLAGESFLAMRSSLIDQFDQCLIIDLGGDSRSPSKSEIDENVFDIQTGVAISIWYTTAHREAENPRRYKALPGERKAKYTALLEANKSAGSPFDGWKTGTHRLTPISQNTFWDWPRLKDLFGVCSPGVKSHRDSLVIGETKSVLKRKIARFVSLADRNKIVETFGSSHHRSADVAHAASFDESMIVPIKYRQFDYRWIYYHPSYVELPRPILRNAFFDPDHAQIRNIALVTLNKGHGEGAGCCVAECLPDMHLFRGSYGGTAFPLWRHDRVFDQHRQVSNLSRSVVKGLAKRWGHVEDSEVFAYIVAVLGSAAYTKQYSSDLKDEEVRIPFTVSRELASYLIDLGNKIIALSTQSDGLLAQEEAQEEALAQGRCDRGASWAENAVHLGSGGVIPGVLLEVWNYSCSGYPVVRNWIAKRHGVPLTGDELGRLRILLNSILELTQIVRAVDGCVREVLGGEILTASDLND